MRERSRMVREEAKLGFIIVTHGSFGREMLKAAQYIMGDRLKNFQSIEVPFMTEMGDRIKSDSGTPFGDRRAWLGRRISQALSTADQGAGVIIFTDIVGGTAFNVSRELVPTDKGAIIAGVNLPMLLKAAGIRGLAVNEAARELTDRSRRAIAWVISDH